ncbi:hypothetical protein ES319_A10G034800v1 [Gossypium barbadense]|uniref:Bidirectional sugar transporter SWEET n=2 Tax=Gossypium barbadense TaxID=3634 RepID=A0A5J5TYV3_GOSBA|nr:hypothetical protein ES319_A10G034800v1 [Gossypium barbadense]
MAVKTGIAGNIFAFGLFLSPIPTFRRIIRNGSTEQFSGMPYIYALLNCLICLWYGFPIISPVIILVATVNSIGAIFQLIYIIIFIAYATKPMKLKMLGFLVSVFASESLNKFDIVLKLPMGLEQYWGQSSWPCMPISKELHKRN